MNQLSVLLSIFLFCANSLFAQVDTIPPGVIINHIPQSTGKYIGSPSICIVPNGDYIASHDEFGPKSTEFRSAYTNIFSSNDKGKSWNRISRIEGQFWSNLFLHKGDLYIMGTNKHHGNLIIRKSTDGGKNWTIPYDGKNGLILEGEYHTAPVPMLIHKGRIWRAVEYATSKTTRWGRRYSAVMLSAKVNSDLLNAKSWTRSNHLPYDATYLEGEFGAWLEGNAVATKDGNVVDILRVHAPKLKDEYCAIVNVDKRGKKIRFDRENFFKMPGASKKFSIRYDEQTDKYWSIVNNVNENNRDVQTDRARNTVSLVWSDDLTSWTIHTTMLHHPDPLKHGFQYIDWMFEGDDIIYVSRTAYDDDEGGAHTYHNANYITFHRVADFRGE